MNPATDDIFGISDPIGGSNPNGDNTVRASNVIVDSAATRPSITQVGFTPQTSSTNQEVIPKVISGIHYYNSSTDYFYLNTIITGAFSNTFIIDSLLNYTTDSLTFPSGVSAGKYGQSVDLTELTNVGGTKFSATANIPDFTTPAFYSVNASTNNTRYLYPTPNSFSVKARVSAYAKDPYGNGATLDAYGTGLSAILINAYAATTANASTEYFVDEAYRIGTAETFASLFTANQFATGNTWNSNTPLLPGQLQVGGQGVAGITSTTTGHTPYIPGLIFPQESYTSPIIRPAQTTVGLTDYSTAPYQVNSIYQRALTINSTMSEGILQISSGGLSPISFNDLRAGNSARLLKIELCIPGVTGLLDIGKLFSTGQIGTPGDGGAGFGCLDAEPYTDTPGFISLPFTFGEFNNSTSGDMIAVRVTYFGSEFALAKNVIITKIQLLARTTD